MKLRGSIVIDVPKIFGFTCTVFAITATVLYVAVEPGQQLGGVTLTAYGIAAMFVLCYAITGKRKERAKTKDY
ncbi:hypothetical protein ACFVYC_10940 [Pseudarthrobacter sp. NPDC058329]|uniref:hypothetical protein n=1 Tax=Pseudarthrobacter sp. NPDC058329 TaxID=3346448 RepID=UPI0036DAE06D